MRFSQALSTFILFFHLFLYSSVIYLLFTYTPTPTPPIFSRKDYSNKEDVKSHLNKISFYESVQIILLGTFLLILLVRTSHQLLLSVKFYKFSTNLSTKRKQIPRKPCNFSLLAFMYIFGLLLVLYEESWYFLILNINVDISINIKSLFKITYIHKRYQFLIVTNCLLHLPYTTGCEIFCIVLLYNLCFLFKSSSTYLVLLLILLSNDVHQNPGPVQKSYFTFMNWNCNSLAKGDFDRLKLLETENSLFDYDIISLCETSLNNDITVPSNEYFNNNYTFISANKPDGTRHGGVGLFYRNDLPVTVRRDLSFDECIVLELKFGRKKYSLQHCIEVLLVIIQHLNLQIF